MMSSCGDPEDDSLAVIVEDGLDNLFVSTPVGALVERSNSQ